jgi:hypothetical protein
MRYPGFIHGSYAPQNPTTDQEQTTNWYLEKSESEAATSPASLLPTPGFTPFVTAEAVGGRAMFEINGRCFGVVADDFLEIFSDGTITTHGTVAIDENPATICSNGDGGNQLLITSGDNGYCFDLLTDTLTLEVTGGCTQGGMLYGYGVLFDRATSSFRISDLFDMTTWDPTQTAANAISQDDWQSMLVTPYGQIFLPGSQTGQFWYNAGTFPFPFAPDPSGLVEEGIAATFSLKFAGKSAVWLSTNKNGGYQVMRASGFTPERISDHALEYELSQLTRLDDAIGETYEDQGHSFYLLTIPSARITRVLDFATGEWHNRGTWISETNSFEYLRPMFHCFAFNKHLMADRESAVIYQMDISLTTDIEERPIRRVRRAPALVNDNLRLFYPKFEVMLETGLGYGTGNTSNARVMLRTSNDGGKTFSNEREMSAGAVGQYGLRCVAFRTGAGRQRVFEIAVTDAVNNWRLTDAYVRVEKSTEAA